MRYDLKGDLFSIDHVLEDAMFDSRPKKPDLLFHYTNAVGFHGILKSKTLWATRFEFLSDRSEYTYAQTFLIDHLRTRGDELGKMLSGMSKKMVTIVPYTAPHYVASTSTDGDSLGQWRGYSGIHDGYAIAFSREKLSGKQDLGLTPMIYSPVEQRAFLDRILDRARDVFLGVERGQRKDVLKAVLTVLSYAMYSLKDASFSGENEWRVVAHDFSGSERFRVVGGQIVPYLEIPLESGDIDHIVQGPGIHPLASGLAVERFASSSGFDGVKVKTSSVPIG